jgi:hypothetical protein
VSFKATAAVWAARDAQLLEAGAPLFVCLALADRANNRTGIAKTGVRGIAERTGLGQATIVRALRSAAGAGVIELVEPGRGNRPARYRIALSTRRANVGDNDAVARHPESANGNFAFHERFPDGTLRAPSEALARHGGSETGFDLLNSYEPTNHLARTHAIEAWKTALRPPRPE